jgi:hypothetical protein
MARHNQRKLAYGVSALVVLGLTAMWAGTFVYGCPDASGAGATTCGPQTADIVIKAIVSVMGLGVAAWLAFRALRQTPPPAG